jgi:hypothetical protein
MELAKRSWFVVLLLCLSAENHPQITQIRKAGARRARGKSSELSRPSLRSVL